MTVTSIALLMLTFACSKQATTGPVTGEEGKNPPPAVDTSSFVRQQTGVSFRKVNNPKGITDYVLQIPASYNDQKTVKWPVIIFLHGIGERGNDLNQVKNAGLAGKAAADPNFPFIVISPQCKTDSWWDNPSLDALYADVLKQYNIDPQRIYLTGLSMGGYGTWDWAQNAPDKFAAIVPICGGGTPANACVLKSVPVWAFHNADDPTVSVYNSRDMVDALVKCCSNLVKYTENPTGGHDAWTKAYNDPALYDWIKAQKK